MKTTNEVMTRWSFCPILSISVISLHFCPSPCGANCTCIGRGWRSSVAFLAKAAFLRRIHTKSIKIHSAMETIQARPTRLKRLNFKIGWALMNFCLRLSNSCPEYSGVISLPNPVSAAVFGRATLAGHPRSLAWQPFDWAGDWISENLVVVTAHGTPESGLRNENILYSFISIQIILVQVTEGTYGDVKSTKLA